MSEDPRRLRQSIEQLRIENDRLRQQKEVLETTLRSLGVLVRNLDIPGCDLDKIWREVNARRQLNQEIVVRVMNPALNAVTIDRGRLQGIVQGMRIQIHRGKERENYTLKDSDIHQDYSDIHLDLLNPREGDPRALGASFLPETLSPSEKRIADMLDLLETALRSLAARRV